MSDDKPAGMPCPVCKIDLLMSERVGVEIDHCPKCRGVWLDRGELDKIISLSEQQPSPGAPPTPAAPASPPQAPPGPGFLPQQQTGPWAPVPPAYQYPGYGGHGDGHHGGGHDGGQWGQGGLLGRLFR